MRKDARWFRRPAARRRVALGLWLVTIAAIANGVAIAALDADHGRTAVVAFVAGGVAALVTAFEFGRRWNGTSRDLVGRAAGGAFCLAVGSFAAWPSDPGTSTCPGTQPCDTAFGFGMLILGVVLCVPMIVAATAGRLVRQRTSHAASTTGRAE